MSEDPGTAGGSYAEAERILGEFIEAMKAGRPVDTAELCAEHPEHADALRALYDRWLAARGVLDDAAFPHSGVAQAVASADPRITLDAQDSGLAERLLEGLTLLEDGSNRYEVRDEVDRGGMGAILRIWDKNLRRELAMKVMLDRFGEREPSTPAGERSLGRFLEEAQVTGQLDHPGIVPVHELGLDSDGRVYFTMRLVKGRTLASIFELAREGKEGWTRTRVLGLLLKVCEAMSYAHSKGVVHRDLKPANVMVGRFGEVYVMDWGLARVLGREDRKDIRVKVPRATTGSLHTARRDQAQETPDSPLVTMDGDVVGTPSFMAPEQARGELERVDRRSDVYSVGSMLYELLSGEMPYVPRGARVSAHTVLTAVIQGPPRPLEEIVSGVPAELVAICEKAMAREPDSRFADMGQMGQDIQAFLEGRVVRAYEGGPWAEARKWVTRNKQLAASLAAMAVIVVGSLLGLS